MTHARLVNSDVINRIVLYSNKCLFNNNNNIPDKD